MFHRRGLASVFGLAAAMTAVIAGCQPAPRMQRAAVFFPAPPAAPRVQFLTWANGAEELESKRGTFEAFVLGEEPTVRRAIQKPYGIAARDGVVYVCDTKGLSLCRLDFRNHSFSVVGTNGPGRLRKPIHAAIHPP